ncbi:IS21 family transposase [Bosea sp. (in: a-proteobacteria)]|uniref:IS21 family transposase n=1 Tax=Bosea sp. (in: a-proteobacteria) TaxID=1871050 RepID=UPI0027345DE6|nr:IS21 family transposase [Bosea sp. (in: a-proteobacteria)]MDP3410004.1 IS21 family transposase [Bosea sp. (in: a-proteobacteria)]
MAGKPRPMSQIKQLLRLHRQGCSIKAIARTLSISKNTVKSYLVKLQTASFNTEELLILEDPVLESRFHSGNPAYKDPRYIHLKGKLEYFSKELKRVGVTKKLLWEEYIASFPQGYAYSQFCFHLHQQLVARKPTSVLTHEPADKLFVDFAGKQISYTDRQTGEIIHCQLFVACLPFSDYAFAIAVPSQTVSDFLYALSRCLEAIGGVPKVLVPDNLKAAIIKADRYEPEVNRSLEDFANHYGMAVVPARAAKPRDKGLVENQVKLLYTRVYAKLRNRIFFDLATLNEAISEKVREHNQTRMQNKNYCREERYLAAEKPLLSALPPKPFELKYYAEAKVASNGHVSLLKHFYSVPYSLIGSRVKVIYTRTMVYIYAQGKQVGIHLRSYSGGYSSTKEHLSSQNQAWLNRSPEYYLERARYKSEELHRLFELVFQQDRYPEQLYRTCDGLLRLSRNTDPEKFSRVCRVAIENRICSYKSIQKILENNMAIHLEEESPEQSLPVHTNIRGKEYYTQSTINF